MAAVSKSVPGSPGMSAETSSGGQPAHNARRVLISGSNGFIGQALVTNLRHRGDIVVSLLRGEASAGTLHWNPGSGVLDPEMVSGFDTVIHLAGEPVVGLWTSAKKRRILESRVRGTSELAHALAAASRPPRLFLCASGINFYGNNRAAFVDESSPM